MSSGPASGRPQPGRQARLRALVLLLALLLAGAPTAALAAGAPTTSAASADTLEHDVLDTPLRPPARTVHRADVPERPSPLPGPAADGCPADHHRPCPTAPRPPYAAPLLRTVVLRC
ncbi:hypothetical protein [Streptomyces sp. NPDC101234]|uniref:hypothetical protein n=1 Tax=Streptomyces sp. NPDC101234 TaxID=3366138 RepID=UPI003814563D